jgi:anti-sigma-K factor RskA
MTPATGPGHQQWEDASGAYVLGALPDDEAEAYAAHLAVCPACRAEVEQLQAAAAALPASVHPVAVPVAIGERVMAEVRREAELLTAAGGGADRVAAPARAPRPRRAWWRWPVPVLAAAALLLGLAVGLGAAGVIGGGSDHTITMTATGIARGANARLVMDGRATLEVDHLPRPGGGRVYQVWLKPAGGEPQPTKSLFLPRADGDATVAVPADAEHMEAVMVTAEPDGGSPRPTSAPVLTATIS